MGAVQIFDATKDEKSYINNQLVSYNNSQVPFTQEQPFIPISKCIKEGDEVVAGILAVMYCWRVLFIDILWVKEEFRGRGYASALLKDVEEMAKEKQCGLSHLDTYDFQARALYEKLGYTVFGVLEDCPEGHCRYFMSKRLV